MMKNYDIAKNLNISYSTLMRKWKIYNDGKK